MILDKTNSLRERQSEVKCATFPLSPLLRLRPETVTVHRQMNMFLDYNDDQMVQGINMA